MKKFIITTLTAFLFFLNGFCQEPSQAEIDKMINDAQSMLSKFQQQGKDTSSLKTIPEKNVATKPKSSIVPIHLSQPVKVPTEAQAKDHLLWYTGKKINDSIIVTTKGMVVLYSKKQNKVTAQPLEKTDPFKTLVNNLSKMAQMTEDYVNNEVAKKNSFMNYPLIQMSVDEFNRIDDRLKDVVKNTIDLPVSTSLSMPLSTPSITTKPLIPATTPASTKPSESNVPPITTPTPEKPLSSEASDLYQEGLNEMHRQLKQLLLNKPPISFDPPPKKEFSLAYLCDTNARHRYIEDLKKWEEAFLGYEKELASKDLQIERSMQLMGMDPDADASLRADLDEGLNVAFSRWDEKVKLLTAQYSKDVFRQEYVVTAILSNERQKQLMGRSSGGTNLDIDFFFGPEFENYINEQIGKKNWDVILNTSLLLGRQRQAQLFGNNEADQRFDDLRQRVLKLNRFALTADVEFNIQFTGDGELALKASGKIETSDKTFVSLSRIGCKWTLMLSEPDYEDAKQANFCIPMNVTTGIKSVKVDKDKWKDYSYSGPKDMLLPLPVFRIDFSERGQQDSATLTPARFLPDAILSGNISEAYNTDFWGFMNFVFIVPSEEPGKSMDMMALANEMMGKIPRFSNMSASSTPLESLKNKNLIMQIKQEAEQKTVAASFNSKAVFLFNAVNNSSILIDKSVDTKYKDGEMELTKSIIKIKVVHDPPVN